MVDKPSPLQLFTIGALSRATGVPPDTLRTWERRYGFPKPERTDTGHRRYSVATLERLQLVREALQLGHRAAAVLGAEHAALRELIQLSRVQLPVGELDPADDAGAVERWLDLTRRFDGRGLERELRTAFSALGARAFLERRAAPFIEAVGNAWAAGSLGIRHEHYASERLNEFFLRQWGPLSDACSGPIVVCATTSGERHALGLQMAALTLALNNLRIVYLGADLPAIEIAQSATQHSGRAVVLSAAQGSFGTRLKDECAVLRQSLAAEIPIVVGGRGFGDPIDGVERLASLTELDHWAQRFGQSARQFPPRLA